MFDFLRKKINSWLGKEKTEKAKRKTKKKEKNKASKKAIKKIKKQKSKKVEEKTEEISLDSSSNTSLKTEAKSLEKQKTEEILESVPIAPSEDLTSEEFPEKEEVKEENFFSKIFKKITSSKLSQDDFEEAFSELEIALLENNVALEVVDALRSSLSSKLVGQQMKKTEAQQKILDALKDSITSLLQEPPSLIEQINASSPYIIIFFGINGTGKTTTIAKIAHFLKKQNISSVMAAADTFRAASIEQLKIHAEKLSIPVVSSQYGADPASVAFDAINYAKKNKIQVVLIDTAGRMYTKANLMKEMEKIIRISKPNLKIFVGESITGNDAINQVKTFNEAIGIDGVVLTKADVDKKAGTILSVSYVTGKPIYFLGTGQNYEDIITFSKKAILKNLGLE